MGACTTISTLQLLGTAFVFLAGVVWLDIWWVHDPQVPDSIGAPARRRWVNVLVALGGAGAAVALIFWAGNCSAAPL